MQQPIIQRIGTIINKPEPRDQFYFHVSNSARELGWTIAVHDLHHLTVVEEKYGVKTESDRAIQLKIDG